MRWKRQYVQCKLVQLAKGRTLDPPKRHHRYLINREYHREHRQFIGEFTFFPSFFFFSNSFRAVSLRI